MTSLEDKIPYAVDKWNKYAFFFSLDFESYCYKLRFMQFQKVCFKWSKILWVYDAKHGGTEWLHVKNNPLILSLFFF